MKKKSYGMDKKQIAMIAGIAAMVIIIIILIAVKGAGNKSENQDIAGAISEENTKNEMAEELDKISTYLDQLDTTVITNQESLEEIGSYSEEVTNQFITLEESLTDIDSLLVNYLDKYQTDSKDILLNITSIQDEITTVQTQMKEAQTTIESLFKESASADASRQEEIRSSFAEVGEKIADAKYQLSLTYESLVSMLDILQLETEIQHNELITMLTDVETHMSELFQNEMSQLSTLVSAGNHELQLKIDKDVEQLTNRMNFLHDKIAATQEELKVLLGEMEESDVDRQEEIEQAFMEVQNSLEQINQEFHEAYAEIKELLVIVAEMESANHTELLNILGDMEKGMEESSNSNLAEILSTMSQMQENYNLGFSNLQSEMNQSFENLDTNINSQIFSLTEMVSNQYTDLTNIVNVGDDGLREYITEGLNGVNDKVTNSMGSIEQKLESVFQYVSDGKKLMASALLTKGVTVSADATFNEFANAILNVPQQLVIGVEKLPGEITYDYHYHTDKNGSFPHAASMSEQGGCYTTPIYHVHTGSSAVSGGCYTVPNYHSHSGSCYSEGSHTDSCPSHIEYHSYDCSFHDYDGDGHGCDGFIAYDCGGHRYLSCRLPGITHYSLGCGMGTSTVIGYNPGCGLSDGQIIGAHIVYN